MVSDEAEAESWPFVQISLGCCAYSPIKCHPAAQSFRDGPGADITEESLTMEYLFNLQMLRVLLAPSPTCLAA